MASKILLLEKNPAYAKQLISAMMNLRGHEVVHVNTELAVVRELTASHFDLIIAGIYSERKKEGQRLLQLLLVEKKVVTAAQVMVLSDDQDTAFVQSCIKSGVSDYLLYPENPIEVMPRLEKVLAKSGGIGEMLVRVATTFLGPATPVFMERQAKKVLHLTTLNELTRDHLPRLLKHLAVAIRPVLKEKVVQFIHRLEQVFGVQREN